jgi:hypothetical protein
MTQIVEQRKNIMKSLRHFGIPLNLDADRRPSPSSSGSQELVFGALEGAVVAGLFPNVARVCLLLHCLLSTHFFSLELINDQRDWFRRVFAVSILTHAAD